MADPYSIVGASAVSLDAAQGLVEKMKKQKPRGSHRLRSWPGIESVQVDAKACTRIPAPSNAFRTAAAIETAVGVSLWTQMESIGVSKLLPVAV